MNQYQVAKTILTATAEMPVLTSSLCALLCVTLLNSSEANAQLGGFFSSDRKIPEIKTSQLAELINGYSKGVAKAKASQSPIPEANFVVVDVRSQAEFSVSLIPGAITKADYERNSVAYKDKLVIPYCTIGGRSGEYAKKLAGDGVSVKNYKGSILEWVEAELPLVTLQGKPTNRVHTYSDRYKVPAKYEQVTAN